MQLAEQLKALILSQQLPAGARVPAERELMGVSGLSRITVRAAVGMLERQGWVVRKQGLGTFVTEPLDQERRFEAIDGARRAIVHLYNSTSVVQRHVVFGLGREGITDLAVGATALCRPVIQPKRLL